MKEILTRYITQELIGDYGDGAPQEDDDLLGMGLIDSVGMMSLVLFIEDTFGVPVPPEDVTIENFFSINTIDAYLTRRRA